MNGLQALPLNQTFERFVVGTNEHVAELYSAAQDAESSEPGTAALLRARAEQIAGSALDLIAVWPTEISE